MEQCVRYNWSLPYRGSFSGPIHVSPVTGLARLAGRSLPSVHMGNFSSVTEMNKARPFKLYPGNRAGVLIWENF